MLYIYSCLIRRRDAHRPTPLIIITSEYLKKRALLKSTHKNCSCTIFFFYFLAKGNLFCWDWIVALLRHALSQIMTGFCERNLVVSPSAIHRPIRSRDSFFSLPLSLVSYFYFYCARVQEKTKRDTTDSRTDAGALRKQEWARIKFMGLPTIFDSGVYILFQKKRTKRKE